VSFDETGKHEMVNDEIHEIASLYTLGLLDPELAAGFERHLDGGCAVCRSELSGFNEAAGRVLEAIEYAEPPSRLRDELLKRIASDLRAPLGQSAPAGAIFRAAEGEWQESDIPGVRVKQLFVDPTSGSVSKLIRLAAGAIYPPHRHLGLEHCYVLEGDLVFDDHTLYAGDYEVAAGSTDHSLGTTKHGCLLLIINNQQVQLLA
jgi:quercetin dioxygenase-like cupin family protein